MFLDSTVYSQTVESVKNSISVKIKLVMGGYGLFKQNSGVFAPGSRSSSVYHRFFSFFKFLYDIDHCM